MTTTWKPHVTVATVVPDGHRYLLVEELVNGRQVINQPAGHLEPGESLLEAARRETLEESRYEVQPTALLGIYRWVSPRGKCILRFAFSATVTAHHPDRLLDDGILHARWMTRGELERREADLRSPLVLRNIADFEAGRRFPLDLLDDLCDRAMEVAAP